MELKNKIVFIDYEGTISESPKGSNKDKSVTLGDLLFRDIFTDCKPISKIKKHLSELNPKNIYVLGVIDTNKEIDQKYKWIERFYPFILKQNVIFIANNHKKADVINEYQKMLGVRKEDVVFIDDKESHLQYVRENGYTCYNVNEII